MASHYGTIAPVWRIELFGGLRLRGSDRVVTRFRTSKTGTLLALLSLNAERGRPREVLAEMLWPDADDGRLSLRVALSSLRRQLEPPGCPAGSVLMSEGGCVRLNPSSVTTDIQEFKAALQRASNAGTDEERERLASAVALYRGEVLEGFYDDWLQPERERMAHLWIGALERLSSLFADCGDFDRAIEYGLLAAGADPLREEGQQNLIRLYVAAGRPADAVRRYRALERGLKAHLDTVPCEATRSLVGSLLKDSVPLDQAGVRRVIDPIPSGPAIVVRDLAAPRLPLILTRFFGREEELARLADLLCARCERHSDARGEPARLVTLTGPGGAGKTRLALETARRLNEALQGRIWFAALADVSDGARIPEALLQALQGQSSPEMDPLVQAATVLGSQPSILILDNMEHLVVPGREYVRQLLERAPSLQCLITSRHRLGLLGERELAVPPLPTPDERDSAALAHLLGLASVQVFIDRAQAVRPDFQIMPGNSAAIAALMVHLEGIPLAIELAAAWIQTLTPAQMVAKMSDRFGFLVSRGRPDTDRHRTLFMTLEWSYQLLPPEHRRFLARLSVFRGGARLAAIRHVCAETDALALLTDLRERSLVLAEDQGSEMRFRLLESVRDFARKKMEDSEYAELQARHTAHYLGLLESAAHGLRTADQAECMAQIALEYANGVAALEECVNRDDGLRLAAALAPYWQRHGRVAECAEWLEKALAANPDAQPLLRARAWCALAALHCLASGKDRAMRTCSQALRLCEALPDRQEALEALGLLTNPTLLTVFTSVVPGVIDLISAIRAGHQSDETAAFVLGCEGQRAHLRGDYSTADALYVRSLALYQESGDLQGAAIVSRMRGHSALYAGDRIVASRLWQESLAIYRRIRDQMGVTGMIGDLGYLAYRCADFPAAEQLMRESLELDKSMGRRAGIAGNLWVLANVARCRADYSQAEDLLAKSLEIRRSLGDSTGIADTLSTMGVVAQSQGDLRRAQAYQEESLAIRRMQPDRIDLAHGLGLLGDVLIRTGDVKSAEAAYRESLALSQEMDSMFGAAGALLGLAAVSLRRTDPAQSTILLRESADLYQKLEVPIRVIECAEGLAAAFAAQALPDLAARLYAGAQAERDRLGAPLPPPERDSRENTLRGVRAALGEEAYSLAEAGGRSLTLDDMLDLAKCASSPDDSGSKLTQACPKGAPK